MKKLTIKLSLTKCGYISTSVAFHKGLLLSTLFGPTKDVLLRDFNTAKLLGQKLTKSILKPRLVWIILSLIYNRLFLVFVLLLIN